jgi:hypothetical protein
MVLQPGRKLLKKFSRTQSWGGHWLNPSGKSVLLKSILSSLFIFQCLGLLAPKGTLEKISRVLRSFLWVGGKTNTKKFHLLNWKQVCQPLNKGGLSIKDPILMNTSLGEKLAWRLITGTTDWQKTALIAKYFNSSRLCCLDAPTSPLPGSPIWCLLKNAFPLIKSKLSWAPGNKAHINVWIDRILDHDPLNSLVSLHPLKYWCYSEGLYLLKDFCQWNSDGDWTNWKPSNTPDHIRPLISTFFNNFGCAPSHLSLPDSHSWGEKMFFCQIQLYALVV